MGNLGEGKNTGRVEPSEALGARTHGFYFVRQAILKGPRQTEAATKLVTLPIIAVVEAVQRTRDNSDRRSEQCTPSTSARASPSPMRTTASRPPGPRPRRCCWCTAIRNHRAAG